NPLFIIMQLRFLLYKKYKSAASAMQNAFYDGMKPNYNLVFNKYLGRHQISKYQAKKNEIFEIGNFSSEQINDENSCEIPNYRYLLFIDQPIPQLNISGKSIDLSSFYSSLATLLNQNGIQLLIKPHPKTLQDNIIK